MPLTWLQWGDILLLCRSTQSYHFSLMLTIPGRGQRSLLHKSGEFLLLCSRGAFSSAFSLLNTGRRRCLPVTVGKLVERARMSQVNRWLALPDYRLGYRSANYE